MTKRKYRENVRRAQVSPRTGPRWSRWYTALVPEASNSKNYEPRERDPDDEGFIYSKIRTRFVGKKYDNGIYELRVSKGRKSRKVVYIGAAHRNGPGSLSQRILEYCRGGSHKDDLINRVLSDGYTIKVRAKNIRGKREFVYECEDRYLDKYDYAWNERNNGSIRNNVPPPQ